jgi:hypothetical protein
MVNDRSVMMAVIIVGLKGFFGCLGEMRSRQIYEVAILICWMANCDMVNFWIVGREFGVTEEQIIYDFW